MNNHHYYYKKKGQKMQESTINITEEMKKDAQNIIESMKNFKKKYNIQMVTASSSLYLEDTFTIYDRDSDSEEGFYTYDIKGDTVEKNFVKHIK